MQAHLQKWKLLPNLLSQIIPAAIWPSNKCRRRWKSKPSKLYIPLFESSTYLISSIRPESTKIEIEEKCFRRNPDSFHWSPPPNLLHFLLSTALTGVWWARCSNYFIFRFLLITCLIVAKICKKQSCRHKIHWITCNCNLVWPRIWIIENYVCSRDTRHFIMFICLTNAVGDWTCVGFFLLRSNDAHYLLLMCVIQNSTGFMYFILLFEF